MKDTHIVSYWLPEMLWLARNNWFHTTILQNILKYLLDIPRLSAYTILHVQAGFIHVICLGISNKSVAVPRQDSIRPYRAHAVMSTQYIHTYMPKYSCNSF